MGRRRADGKGPRVSAGERDGSRSFRCGTGCAVSGTPAARSEPARAFVKGLEQIHCGFALEQFGSGLNSFQLLKHVPAHYLKIDRNYMAELPKHKENQEKIKEICDQAHHAGKLTVAEFVEDAASMSILFSCGVNFVQGNFLQEPEKVMAHG